jgi:type IV secretory pathway VirB2 component (pilin)
MSRKEVGAVDDRGLRRVCRGGAIAALASVPVAAFAQAAASPFDTGAQSLLTFMLTIAAPVAAILVIGVCIAAASSLISWGAVVRVIVGIAGIFGAVQLVAWIRGMFGV